MACFGNQIRHGNPEFRLRLVTCPLVEQDCVEGQSQSESQEVSEGRVNISCSISPCWNNESVLHIAIPELRRPEKRLRGARELALINEIWVSVHYALLSW